MELIHSFDVPNVILTFVLAIDIGVRWFTTAKSDGKITLSEILSLVQDLSVQVGPKIDDLTDSD